MAKINYDKNIVQSIADIGSLRPGFMIEKNLKRDEYNYFGYGGDFDHPIDNYDKFIDQIIDDMVLIQTPDDDDEPQIFGFNKLNLELSFEEMTKYKEPKTDPKVIEEIKKKVKDQVDEVISRKINTVYQSIESYGNKPFIFEFKMNRPVTYGMLLYTNVLAYHYMYETELQDIKKNNPKFNIEKYQYGGRILSGRYGIDLRNFCGFLFNGRSKLSIYKKNDDEVLICMFGRDT